MVGFLNLPLRPLNLDYTFPARRPSAPDIGLKKLNVGSGVLISIPHTELKLFKAGLYLCLCQVM